MNDKSLQAVIIPVTPFRQNCSLVWCAKTMKGVFVDPGGESERLLAIAREKGVEIEKILLTHGHGDHASNAALLARKLGVKIEGPHQDDLFLLEKLKESGEKYGIAGAANCLPDRFLNDGDTVRFGEVTMGVRHCPGHTPGHVVFFHETMRIAFVGDVLFMGSIGRTDLPRGDFQQLVEAITKRLWPLGDDMNFVPGHGQMSTFGWERKTNPYVSDLALGRD